jgi:ribosomal protein S18 acetylase RimI-like enzyme
VREHFGKIASGETIVWGAFQDAELVGLISSEVGGGYWLQTGHGEKTVSFINEFVVNPELRGRNIGQNLTKISVDPVLGIFGIKPNIKEQYTTFHQNNIGSRTAFMKGAGYTEVCTYEDAFRKRNTTVAKYAPTRNIVPQDPPDMLHVNQEGKSWTVKGITYRLIERSYDPEALFQFNKTHGSTPHNFIPDGPVREHLGKIATGETMVRGAFSGGELVGFISGECGGGYWSETGAGDNVCFIHEFVVNPGYRGKSIGKYLTKISVDASLGIFGIIPAVREMYTTFHIDNMGSRTAFIKGAGYHEVMTYADEFRDRSTSVAKYAAP